MLSKFLSRFAALHTFYWLPDLSNLRLYFIKARLFSFVVYCCTHRAGWRSQRQSEKVNIRNACFLPVRAKCGRFCVLMNGRACTQRTVSFWSSDCSNSPNSVLAERRFLSARSDCHRLTPCSGERKSRFGSKESPNFSISRRGDHRTRAVIITAAEFSGLCPPPLSQSWGSNRKPSSYVASY